MYKVLVTSRSFGKGSREPVDLLTANHCEIIDNPYPAALKEDELLGLVKDLDGMVVGEDEVTARVIEAAERLRVISKVGVGVDKIDVGAATERGIVVTNTPGVNRESVADLAFALILALARHLPRADAITKGGEWKALMGVEVYKKVLGVIGLGDIGKALARRASGFDMTLLAHDIHHDGDFAQKYSVRYITLDELLRRSDFVSLHVPLAEGTDKLIGSEEIKLMRRTSYLINTSRGGVVDEGALCKALNEKRIAGAGVDVYSVEPPIDNPLLKLPNIITTPHIGSFTYEGIRNMGLAAAENLVKVFRGERPISVLNPESLRGVR